MTAYIGVEVCETTKTNGFGTLIRVSDNHDMEFAARQIAQRLKLNGVFGLDFVIKTGTDHAYLIEMNPRVTPLAHFRFGLGQDPAAALYDLATSANAAQFAPPQPGCARENGHRPPEDLIGVFPHVLTRGVTNSDGVRIIPDVPWDQPDLIRLTMPLPRSPLAFVRELWSRFLV